MKTDEVEDDAEELDLNLLYDDMEPQAVLENASDEEDMDIDEPE